MAELGLGPVPFFASADVLTDPMDLCHSYLAEHFQRLVEADPESCLQGYPASKHNSGRRLGHRLASPETTWWPPKRVSWRASHTGLSNFSSLSDGAQI